MTLTEPSTPSRAGSPSRSRATTRPRRSRPSSRSGELRPEAEIVVFDNNSTDGTGDDRARPGGPGRRGPRAGQGARRPRDLRGPGRPRSPSSWSTATGPIRPTRAVAARPRSWTGSADMVVGARRPVAELGAMTPIRGLGNVLIGSAFRVLIGPGTGDLLSGYRVFGRRFLEVVRPRSSGFEIEAELSGEAVARGCGWSRSPSPTIPGSPGPPASSGPSATARGSC